MHTTRLQRVIAAAIGRRRRFALDDARTTLVRERLRELDPAARTEHRLTCYLDRSDGSLVAAALSRPWACLELSCSTLLDQPGLWELAACRTRGPTLTQARLHTAAALLPAIARGDAPAVRGDGTNQATGRLAAWRTFLALRGNGPLLPSLAVFAERLEVRLPRTLLVLECRREVTLAPPSLLEDAAAGQLPSPRPGRALPGGVLEVQLPQNMPPAIARLVEGLEQTNGSAFATACGVAFPAGAPGVLH